MVIDGGCDEEKQTASCHHFSLNSSTISNQSQSVSRSSSLERTSNDSGVIDFQCFRAVYVLSLRK